jgi:hypothetical protein
MSKNGKVNSTTPGESGKRPLSSSQSSGQTQHTRMTTAKKVEGKRPSGMPSMHC